MSEMDISSIRVGKFTVGIIGLMPVLQSMAGWADRPESETQAELVRRLSAKNYIPDGAKEDYGNAFLREFEKFLGKEVAEDRPEGLEIKVLGQGCTQCDRLEQELMAVMTETGVTADVDHVRDLKEIGKYGVLGMPALIINGKVKSVGKVPSKADLRKWLGEAKDR